MYTIEIDFDVYKELTMRRKTEDFTNNDVLREVFGLSLEKKSDKSAINNKDLSWVSKGVTFPHGTEFRAPYKGEYYYGKVENGALIVNGKKFTSPSKAAISITHNSVNGWIFWECKLPGSQTWRKINELRSKKP